MLCDVIEYAKIEREELVRQGEAKGKLKQAIEIAKNMLMENLPISIIAKTTQLSEEQVRELAV